ncbi:MAG: hypothetical protein KF893_03015 [Caldilineaceae bacterium]|nr:hypothetical protein [Caldilineaceae bacterium]
MAAGKRTAQVAQRLTESLIGQPYRVLYDHGPSAEAVGRIVSWYGDSQNHERQLSFIDIAVVRADTDEICLLIEVEETTNKPKVLLGDVLSTLLGESISFRSKPLRISERTVLVVAMHSAQPHPERLAYLDKQIAQIQPHLETGNARIGQVRLLEWCSETDLHEQISQILQQIVDNRVTLSTKG